MQTAKNILQHQIQLGKGEEAAQQVSESAAAMRGMLPSACNTEGRERMMSDLGTEARIVLTTAASGDEARMLGRTLVEERLAACATLVPTVESIYRWEGKVETARETLLLIKTAAGRVESLKARLLELHSYETPEVLVLPVESGSDGYLGWLWDSLLKA